MLSSDLPSALTPYFSSVIAASNSNKAVTQYPKLTRHADPDSISQPNNSGEVPPPIAVPIA
jgi:hypothetical protein